ncbi:unnamed protein product [Closterium sp. NIES-64]|nr:unnamed protein product [Closterium sp. NIES-64]
MRLLSVARLFTCQGTSSGNPFPASVPHVRFDSVVFDSFGTLFALFEHALYFRSDGFLEVRERGGEGVGVGEGRCGGRERAGGWEWARRGERGGTRGEGESRERGGRHGQRKSVCEEDHIPAVADRMVLRKLVPTDRIMVLRKLAQDMREWIHRRVSHGIRGDCYGMVPEREVYEAGCRGSLLCSLSPHSSPNPPPLPLHASFQRLFPTPLAHTTPPHLLPTPSLLPLSPTPFPHAFPHPLSPPTPFPPRILLIPIPPPTPFPHAFFSPLSPTSFPHAFSSPPSPPPSLSPSHFAHPFPPPTPFPHAISSPLSPFKTPPILHPDCHPHLSSVHSPVSSIHPLPSLHPHIDQQALISTLRPVVRVEGEDAPHGHDGEGPEGVRPRVKVGQGGERRPRLVQQREDAAHKRHHGRQILQQREQRVGQACWGRGRADLRLVGGKGN